MVNLTSCSNKTVMNSVQSPTPLPLPPGDLGLVRENFDFFFDYMFFNSEFFGKTRHQKYGSVFKTNILGTPTIFVGGGEAIRFILTNENKYFINEFPPSTKKLLGSSSLSLQTGEEHRNRRKLLYQAFQPRTLGKSINKMEEITQRYLSKWTEQKTITWYPEIRNYTFDIACNFLVGIDFASQTELGHLFETWSMGLFSVPLHLPWTKFTRALHSRQQLLERIETIISQRQQELEMYDNEDALSILLQARDAQGCTLSIQELKDQLIMLLFAGHGTLTSALTSFCLLLGQHSEVLKRCRNEQQQLGKSGSLTQEDLKQMSYLEQVLREVLRLNPPVGGGFRKVIHTCEFNGYQFPEGWNVIYGITFTHQDCLIYSHPQQFDPERFISSEETENLTKNFSYVPFGGGVRECLGKEFARLEMKIFAANLVRNYDWELLPHQNLQMISIPAPHPKDGLKVNFRKLHTTF